MAHADGVSCRTSILNGGFQGWLMQMVSHAERQRKAFPSSNLPRACSNKSLLLSSGLLFKAKASSTS